LNETKNNERRAVPLVEHALSVMRRLRRPIDADADLVFGYNRKNKTPNLRTAWNQALRRAEIQDFRFHDLRHTTASYLAMNGASLAEIAEILGHKTLQMVKRYAHVSEQHTARVVAVMNARMFARR
jgi:integrase